MSAVDLFHNILTKDAVVCFKKKSVDLIEKDEKDNIVTKFTVHDLPANNIVIKADKFPPPRNFFIGTKGENKRADFIIISEEKTTNEEKTTKWIVYVEVKKGYSSTRKEIIQQLKGAQCVMAYCESVAEKFYNEKTGLLNEYKPRFIHAQEMKTTNKQKTVPELGPEKHETPESPFRFPYNNKQKFPFRKLVGKQPS